MKRPLHDGRQVALKYCGGCDPTFDRVAYFKRVRDAARDSIQWVAPEDPNVEVVFVICGCDTACPEKDVDLSMYGRVLTVRNDAVEPGDMVETLLEWGVK